MKPVPRAGDDPDQDSDEAGFLAEVGRFLDHALTPDLRAAGMATIGVHSEIHAARTWHKRLFAQGWIAPAWPVAHGGTGWSARQRFLFERALADADAPILSASGIRCLGPLLIEMGTAEQQARYLPDILNGDALWCQGFSETGAGSDLAALSTRAVREGDFYRVNGAKIWTTGAQHSSHMFALVRTDSSGRRQEGLTFLLIDMTLPGISVRPIPMIHGEAECAEVRFDDLLVPLCDRIGDEGAGWQVAKRLMRHARSNNTTSGTLRRAMRRAIQTAEANGSHNPQALVPLALRLREVEATEERFLKSGVLDDGDHVPSMLKLMASELHQDMATAEIEMAGPFAQMMGHAPQKYFATRAASIYSGTSETHRNMLAAHIFGGKL